MNIEEIVKNIKLDDRVLEHIKYTEEELKNYTDKLLSYDSKAVGIFLYDCVIKENAKSSQLEHALYSTKIVDIGKDILSKYIPVDEDVIKEIHKAVLEDTNHPNPMKGMYRDVPAWTGRAGCNIDEASRVFLDSDKIEDAMKEFTKFYNSKDENLNNPFIKGAIAHILFVSIHPFKDGNGRIARILHHHKMVEEINKLYNHNFTYPIINLSQHYELSRGNYYRLEDTIALDFYNNEAWNNWFNYTLNMIDENIYYLSTRLEKYDHVMDKIPNMKLGM